MATCAACGMKAEESTSSWPEDDGVRYDFMSGMHRLSFGSYPQVFLNRQDNAFGNSGNIDMDPQLEE